MCMLSVKHSQFPVSSCLVPNLDHPILEVEDGYPVRPFPVTASLLPHLGANTILLVPRSIKLTKTMGFPGQNQWKEHDRTCIAYARESIKYAICPAGNKPSQMRVEIHYRRLFWGFDLWWSTILASCPWEANSNSTVPSLRWPQASNDKKKIHKNWTSILCLSES